MHMTIGELLQRAVRLYPHKIVTWYRDQAQDYQSFAQDVERYRAALEAHGLARGDRVAVLSRNHPGMLKALFACALQGVVIVPVNFRLTAAEVAFVLQDSGTRLLWADEHFMPVAQEALAHAEDLASMICEPLDAPLALEPDAAQPAAVEAEDLFGIFYTSGTTGNPKGVMLSHANMMAGVVNHTVAYGLGPADVCLHIMPLYHTMEASMALCQFFVGGGNVIVENFDAQGFWPMVQRYGVTHVTAVFTMLSGMLEHLPTREALQASSLHTISLGGQSVPVEVMRRAVEELGNDRLIQVYGLTEAAPLLTFLPREDVRIDTESIHRLGSVGKDFFLTETRVVDDDGKPVPQGELGEVVARGANIMMGYWQRPDDTERTVKHGWLHTGDIGRYDADGYLYIVDRKKDLIISGGENIAPREVEEVIFQHPNVLECSVFGIPDERWGETVGAAVTTREPMTEQALIEHCAQSLARYKLPRKVWFLESLPRDPVGKIQKRILRDRYASNEAARS